MSNSGFGTPPGGSIELDCPQCNQRLRVPQQHAGRNAQCPKCQKVVTVPFASTTDQPAPTPPAAAPPQQFPSPSAPSAAPGAPAGNPAARQIAPPPPTNPNPGTFVTPEPEAPSGPVASAPRPDAFQLSRTDESPGESTPVRELFVRVNAEIGKLYVGQDELVLGTLVALFSNGHVLIESVPGLGKTLFVRTLGKVLGCDFGRIQFTADLMPSDITGAPIFDMKEQEFRFRPGPVFTQLLLADEINRSPAKTHAALLETMQEYRVTVDGTSHEVDRPFLVLATQNPIESEGTYNLPEAQLDRFMFKLIADYPQENEESEILKMHSQQLDINKQLNEELQQVTSPEQILATVQQNAQVRIEDKLIDYINKLVRMTRQWPQFHMGASPRAGIALMQGARTLAAFRGRDYAIPDDVIQIALPALRHRVILTAEAEVEGHDVDHVLIDMIRTVEVPRR